MHAEFVKYFWVINVFIPFVSVSLLHRPYNQWSKLYMLLLFIYSSKYDSNPIILKVSKSKLWLSGSERFLFKLIKWKKEEELI